MEPDPDEVLHPGTEDLIWSEEHENRMKKKNPAAGYNKFSEHARGMISLEKQCALFCGGRKCKYCTPDSWPKEKMIIDGVFSNWVTENILAMARPADEIIDKYKIIDQFKQAGIKTLINLQSSGEHADCGFGLKKSGFSYDPQRLMENGIYFYNFGWPDYGVAGLSTVLDMVKVMQFAVSQGKVAVHCHAGLGRTGVLIASYLVFTNRITASTAIHYVRSQRKGAIQTSSQMQCIEEFEKYLRPFRVVFASKDLWSPERAQESHEFTLYHYLNRQKHVLHGYEGRKLKYVPKIVYVTCERLLELAQLGNSLSRFIEESDKGVKKEHMKNIQNLPTSAPPRVESQSSLDDVISKKLLRHIKIPRNESESSLLDMVDKTKLQKPKLMKKRSFSMEDLADDKLENMMTHDGSESDTSSVNVPLSWGVKEDDDNERTEVKVSEKDMLNGSSLEESKESFGTPQQTIQDVAEAIAAVDYEDDVYKKATEYEIKLNESDNTWHDLSKERSPHIITTILWEWLDQLKEPVLRVQDMNSMLQFVDEPEVGLQKLEKGSRNTITYILKVFSKLQPIDEDTESRIFEKLLSYLTQQWVTHDNMSSSMSTTESWAMSTRESTRSQDDKDHWQHMKPALAHKLFKFFSKLKDYLDKQDSQSLSSAK